MVPELEISLENHFLKFVSIIYPMDFKMDRDGKGANPREHR